MDKAMTAPSNPKIDSPKVDKCLSRSRVYRTFETAVNPIISLINIIRDELLLNFGAKFQR